MSIIYLRTTWDELVLDALLGSHHGELTLDALYRAIEAQAADRVAKRAHWRASVRQVLRRLAKRGLARHVGRGVWAAADRS